MYMSYHFTSVIYLLADCENLLKKFLILNPAKRATLDVS